MPHSVIFFGTPAFAIPSLQTLYKGDFEIAAVVTQPDKPRGRGKQLQATPIAQQAEAYNLKVHKFEKITPDVITQLQTYNAAIGVVVAYGVIVPQALIDIFPFGIVNVHPSLLPQYRGASPLQAPLLNGDTETGVSIMLIDTQLDHGPILKQKKLRLTGDETVADLHDTLAREGGELLTASIDEYIAGNCAPIPQDHSAATFTKKITKDDGRIDWTKPAEMLEREIRAYLGWPGSFTFWNDTKLTITKAAITDQKIQPGIALVDTNKLYIGTATTALEVLELQLAGKQKNATRAFLQGHSEIDGAEL